MDHMSDQNREFVDMDTPAEGRADEAQSPISMAQDEPPQTPEEVTADNPRPSHLIDMDSPLSQGMYGPRYAYMEDPNRIQIPAPRNDSRTNNSASRNWRPRLTVNNEPKPILPGPPIYYPGMPMGSYGSAGKIPSTGTATQYSQHGAYASPFLGMRNIGVSPENNPPPTVYIRGQPAITLAASPVTKEQQAELERLRRTDYWEKLYHAMQRNVAQEHIVAFTADNGSREFSRWVNTCANYFEIIGILNPAVQGQLAVLAFRGTALDWWRAHRSHSPNYTLSFAQIAEWARTELLPESDPSYPGNG